MKPLPRAVVLLVAASVVLALPFLVMGGLDVSRGRARPDVLIPLLLVAFLLSLRPIRAQTNGSGRPQVQAAPSTGGNGQTTTAGEQTAAGGGAQATSPGQGQTPGQAPAS